MLHEGWKATMSGDRLLLWYRSLADGSWLCVLPEPEGAWAWVHRGPGLGAPGRAVLNAAGRAGHVDEAMRAADEAALVVREAER